MPFRTASSVGVQGNSVLHAHHWEFGASYRYLRAHGQDFFVGTQRTPPPPATQPPGGQPIEVDVHTIGLSLTYALTDQVRFIVAAPIQIGQVSFIQEDHLRHAENTTGLGDVTLAGNAWLFNPREHATGNLMLGLGVKLPTGSYSDSVTFYTPTGTVPRPADPSIQTGDGGVGILTQLEAFHQLAGGALVYLSGFYLFNPRVQTEITIGNRLGLPGNSAAGTVPYHLSVPDALQSA